MASLATTSRPLQSGSSQTFARFNSRLQESITMSPIVFAFLIQNILSKQYVRYEGTVAIMHSVKAYEGNAQSSRIDKQVFLFFVCMYLAGNFHFHGSSSNGRFIQAFSDSSIKLGLTEDASRPSSICAVNTTAGMVQNQWFRDSELPSDINKIRLYTLDTSGERWYLRANVTGGVVDLVCQSYVNNVDNVRQ